VVDLGGFEWAVLGLCAFLIGFSKTGIPGLGILIVPLLAAIFPARASTGVMLPMLIIADLFAVAYYRRHAVWRHLAGLLPWAMVGIALGWLFMGRVDDVQLRPIIGGIVLVLIVLQVYRETDPDQDRDIPSVWWFAAVTGLAAGIFTMMANAAGPIMILYLMAMRLPKQEFIGTGAWYYFLMNWFKVPFSAQLKLINAESLRLNLIMVPVIAVGAVIGILVLHRIPQKAFSVVIIVLATLAAVYLLFP